MSNGLIYRVPKPRTRLFESGQRNGCAMRPTADITLTSVEQSLFNKITLEWEALDYEAFVANGEKVAALMAVLLIRGGIPEQRMQYFTNPAHRTGPPKGSHHDLFRRNGHTDDEMMREAGFLKFFRYFVCGPDLPNPIITEFCEKVRRYGNVGPSDALELGNFARSEARQHRLKPHLVCEEFYKLALDCGIWISHVQVIRQRVKTLR